MTLSLIRTLADLFFGIPQNVLLDFTFLNGDGEGRGEIEEEFIENLGKQCIGR